MKRISIKEVEKILEEKGNLIKADLRFADLRGAYLHKNFCGADLRFADLSRADLRGAILSCADLRFADLRGADLRNAELNLADLRFTDIRGTMLPETKTVGANFCFSVRD